MHKSPVPSSLMYRELDVAPKAGCSASERIVAEQDLLGRILCYNTKEGDKKTTGSTSLHCATPGMVTLWAQLCRDQTRATSPRSRRCSTTWYGVNDICPFCISVAEPLHVGVISVRGETNMRRTHSGSRIGGQSTRACANTGRSLSGAGTA